MSLSHRGAALGAAALALHFSAATAHWSEKDGDRFNLADHHDFIMNVRLRDGGTRCCNGDDIFVGLKEQPSNDGGYKVTIPAGTVLFRDMTGKVTKQLENDTVIDVPPNRVLTDQHAYKACKELIKMGSKTCTPPVVNVLYIEPGSIETKNHATFCYWPQPKGF